MAPISRENFAKYGEFGTGELRVGTGTMPEYGEYRKNMENWR
jgi:hypothetical protein